jgi:formiminoglutamate deiminase
VTESYWCEYAWLGGDQAIAGVLVTVDGDRISAIESDVAAPPAGSTRLDGLTIPGCVNAHSHAFHRALRGRTQLGNGSFWTWREQMYAAVDRLTPETYFALAKATFAEMVCAGMTSVGEFHYLHHGSGGTPYDDPNAMGQALIQAATEAGLRMTLLDTCYLHGGIGTEPNPTQQRFSDGDALSWATRTSALADSATGYRVRVGAAIHSVRAVDPSSMEIVGAWAAGRSAPLHAHVSEQPLENEQCLAAYGQTPTEVFSSLGLVTERFTAVHATHLSDSDISTYGAARATCCFCPTTERDLADGIGPSRALIDAGALLSIGSDSHAVIDPFEETRAIELNERLSSLVRGSHDGSSLLTAATVNGARSLGWADAGTIAVSQLADFVTLGLTSVRLAGASTDSLLESAVFAATASDVVHVVVGGEVVVREGRHVRIDVVRELAASIEALR